MDYDGIALDQLPIGEVVWSDPTHLRRSLRYPGEEDIATEHATEAALDPDRLVGADPTSRTGETIRIIGYSPSVHRVLLVVVRPEEHPPAGRWEGVTARPATRRERQIYVEAQEAR